MERTAGRWTTSATVGETVRAFVPRPLPPEPALALDHADLDLLARANQAVGRLDGLASVIPDPALFIYFYLRKEAVLSSQIEGTQSSLSDLLLFESDQLPGVPLDEVREVSRYTAAMEHGLGRLRSGSLPLSLRLVREIHGILLQDGRGSDKTPGEFRRSQNWIGGTRPGDAHYVPPPPEEIVPCMGDLETFLHDRPQRTSPLIKAALAHAQFETIHPFLDGNGRVGRLLVTLLLCSEGVLAEPILYLSLYLKRNRQEYYDRLQRVRTHGDWEGWLRFFLAGVVQTAEQAVEAARRSLALFEKDRLLARGLGRAAGSALQVHEYMQRNPIVAIPKAAADLGLSPPTITASLHRLGELGIVREITGKQTWRLFAYSDFLSLLTEGTEPIR